MNYKQTKPYLTALGVILLAGTAVVATPEAELLELREQNKQMAALIEKQTAEIESLKAALTNQNNEISTPSEILHPVTPKLTIQKSFSDITISRDEDKAFEGTYIQLFSTRFNEVESVTLEFLFKKHGSKVVREDHFDPFSADRSTQKYKTEIRYETEDPRCLATCNLIKRILEERYGLAEVPVIHDSQYAYKGNRRYVEVYICEDLAGQSLEFKDQKLPLRFW